MSSGSATFRSRWRSWVPGLTDGRNQQSPFPSTRNRYSPRDVRDAVARWLRRRAIGRPRPRRVIVVDDDPAVLRAIGRRLRGRAEIDLILIDNGIDALIQIGAARPDLVIMDVYMPGLDGIEACRRLKTNPETRDIKVIL